MNETVNLNELAHNAALNVSLLKRNVFREDIKRIQSGDISQSKKTCETIKNLVRIMHYLADLEF